MFISVSIGSSLASSCFTSKRAGYASDTSTLKARETALLLLEVIVLIGALVSAFTAPVSGISYYALVLAPMGVFILDVVYLCALISIRQHQLKKLTRRHNDDIRLKEEGHELKEERHKNKLKKLKENAERIEKERDQELRNLNTLKTELNEVKENLETNKKEKERLLQERHIQEKTFNDLQNTSTTTKQELERARRYTEQLERNVAQLAAQNKEVGSRYDSLKDECERKLSGTEEIYGKIQREMENQIGDLTSREQIWRQKEEQKNKEAQALGEKIEQLEKTLQETKTQLEEAKNKLSETSKQTNTPSSKSAEHSTFNLDQEFVSLFLNFNFEKEFSTSSLLWNIKINQAFTEYSRQTKEVTALKEEIDRTFQLLTTTTTALSEDEGALLREKYEEDVREYAKIRGKFQLEYVTKELMKRISCTLANQNGHSRYDFDSSTFQGKFIIEYAPDNTIFVAPDPAYTALTRALSEVEGVQAELVAANNGLENLETYFKTLLRLEKIHNHIFGNTGHCNSKEKTQDLFLYFDRTDFCAAFLFNVLPKEMQDIYYKSHRETLANLNPKMLDGLKKPKSLVALMQTIASDSDGISRSEELKTLLAELGKYHACCKGNYTFGDLTHFPVDKFSLCENFSDYNMQFSPKEKLEEVFDQKICDFAETLYQELYNYCALTQLIEFQFQPIQQINMGMGGMGGLGGGMGGFGGMGMGDMGIGGMGMGGMEGMMGGMGMGGIGGMGGMGIGDLTAGMGMGGIGGIGMGDFSPEISSETPANEIAVDAPSEAAEEMRKKDSQFYNKIFAPSDELSAIVCGHYEQGTPSIYAILGLPARATLTYLNKAKKTWMLTHNSSSSDIPEETKQKIQTVNQIISKLTQPENKQKYDMAIIGLPHQGGCDPELNKSIGETKPTMESID